jgi:ceramide glucosyltransferase
MDRHKPLGRVALIVPCKGLDLDLEGNLQALFQQDYNDYEIIFVVESANDPSYGAIRRLMADHSGIPARVVVAGRARDCGQKVHNLRVATEDLTADVKYLAFADSDARPRPQWLRLLIARLDRADLGATTGYRWFVPARPTLVNALVYSINCGVMTLLGVHNQHWIWGGSWALRKDVFDELALRDAWDGTLSDDMVASRVMARAGRPTRFEPVAVVASPLDHSWKDLFAFIRRQYLMGRLYSPLWWAFGLCFCGVLALTWLCALGAVVAMLQTGDASWWIPLGLCFAVYLLGAFRGAVRQHLLGVLFPQQAKAMRTVRLFDIFAGPLACVVNWLGALASSFGRDISWRGTSYRVFRNGRIRIVRDANEPPDSDPAPDAVAKMVSNARSSGGRVARPAFNREVLRHREVSILNTNKSGLL